MVFQDATHYTEEAEEQEKAEAGRETPEETEAEEYEEAEAKPEIGAEVEAKAGELEQTVEEAELQAVGLPLPRCRHVVNASRTAVHVVSCVLCAVCVCLLSWP